MSDWSSDVCSSDLLALLTIGDDRHRVGRLFSEENPDKALSLLTRKAEKRGVFRNFVTRGNTHTASLTIVLPMVVRTAHVVAYDLRSEEHTSELQSLMRISYAVFCLNKKNLHTT